jgi:putative effector of murein hydrolase
MFQVMFIVFLSLISIFISIFFFQKTKNFTNPKLILGTTILKEIREGNKDNKQYHGHLTAKLNQIIELTKK